LCGDIRDLSYETRTEFDLKHWPWHDAVERFTQDSAYHNFFIYPSVNFITLGGTTFLAQQFCPLAADKTEVRLTMASGRKKKRIPAMPAILWGHMKAEKAVIDEDIVMLEGLQKNLQNDEQSAFHGTYETRLRTIAKTYLRLLDEADV
jgi:phenylpropionate dioxygenase-like ring-hydroxylating dioxygenase large terminal subunit